MKNMSDTIESFIISQLLAASKNAVMVQRNELADRLSCAPSQISYVLSTRFTPERGYMVESRRGSGGFIRIVRLVPDNPPQQKQEENPEIGDILSYWHGNRLLTGREHALLSYMMSILERAGMPDTRRRQILHEAVQQMVDAK